MQKITLVLFVILALCYGNSQAGIEVRFSKTTVYGAINTTVGFGGYVYNRSSLNHSFRLSITEQSHPSGWAVSFCTEENCFPIGVVTKDFSIAAGDSAFILIEQHTNSTLGSGVTSVQFDNLTSPATETVDFTAVLYSFYQSFPLINRESEINTTVKMYGNMGNNISSAVNVSYSILTYDIPADWSIKICDQNGCYDETVGFTNITLSIGATVQLAVKFEIGSTEGLGTLNVKFQNIDDATESTEQTFTVKTSGYVGVQNAQSSLSSLSQNYPNPVFGLSMISYTLASDAGVIFIFDMYGRLMQHIPLHKGKGTLFVEDLRPGVYVYSLWEKGSLVESKRLSVIQ